MAVTLTPEQEQAKKWVLDNVGRCKKYAHDAACRKFDRLDQRYHGFEELKAEWRSLSSQGSRDAFLKSKKKDWGIGLTIPFAYATVETTAPRIVSNRPRMLIEPMAQASTQNVQPMQYTIDSQQVAYPYELELESILKDGLRLGIGWQKTMWRTKKRMMKLLAQGVYNPLIVQEVEQIQFDGPHSIRMDPRDVFYDELADNVGPGHECGWLAFRTWRSTAYVIEMMQKKLWTPVLRDDGSLDVDQIKTWSGKSEYSTVKQGQVLAAGNNASDLGEGAHQVIECWGDATSDYPEGRLITLLDGEWPTQIMDQNPYWHGELPGQTYRPTRVEGQMIGKGEIEPIEDLCEEMDTLRSQRRDAAAMKLNAPGFFDETMLVGQEIKWGPTWMNPTNGSPRDAVFYPPIGDIQNSGYQEEEALAQNISFVSGISDTVTGGDSLVQQTATGAQLIQAAAGIRIQRKGRRLEVEILQAGCRQWVSLDQQKILTNREVRIPAVPTPQDPNRRWAWQMIGPAELAGEFAVEPEGGALAPDNVPQMRADAQSLQSLLGNPNIDARRISVEILRNYGLKNPESYLGPDQRIPQQTLQYLIEAKGVPPNDVAEAINAGRQMEEQQFQAQNSPGGALPAAA